MKIIITIVALLLGCNSIFAQVEKNVYPLDSMDHNDAHNLLNFLPTTSHNYFIDADAIVQDNPGYAQKEFDGLFDLTSSKTKTNWLGHYDALVFIAKG